MTDFEDLYSYIQSMLLESKDTSEMIEQIKNASTLEEVGIDTVNEVSSKR